MSRADKVKFKHMFLDELKVCPCRDHALRERLLDNKLHARIDDPFPFAIVDNKETADPSVVLPRRDSPLPISRKDKIELRFP
jgi:hypothetical protein